MRPSSIVKTALLVIAVVLLTAGASFAADAYLVTQQVIKTGLPGGGTATMWVYACDPTAAPGANTACVASTVSATSPTINVPAGTTSLIIHVRNTLSTPVSVVIPGLPGGGVGAPVPDPGTGRVRSFTHEVAAGATGTYTWTAAAGALKPGTYLYESGTRPSIQVPMGLYGALIIREAVANTAYGETYNFEVPLLFSEIDPVQNAAVAAAGGNAANYPSTVNYNPTYFLINGVAYTGTRPPSTFAAAAGAAAGASPALLVRYLNAGSRSHGAFAVGLPMRLIAEDANKLPTVQRVESTVLLPAGKTMDVIATLLGANGTYPVYDRFLDLTAAPDGEVNGLPDSGMLAYVTTGTGVGGTAPTEPVIIPGQPLVVDDTFNTVTRNVPFAGNVKTNDDVGVGNITVVNNVQNGVLTYDAGTGAFTYTANANALGPDSFTYTADGAPNAALVTLSFGNAAPTAGADGPFVNSVGTRIDFAKPGVLGNDTDLDGDSLTAELMGPNPGGLTLNADGSFSFVQAAAGNYSFQYLARDSHGVPSTPVTVNLTIRQPSGFTLTVRDAINNSVVTSYRWIVEEDRTFHALGTGDTAVSELATNFHRSYMPVVAQGCVGGPGILPAGNRNIADNLCAENVAIGNVVLDPAKYYYISVLPNSASAPGGHTLGGVSVNPGQNSATVFVNPEPLEPAQISILVFRDDSPTNGEWDANEATPDTNEPGMANFQITLFEAGGRYGANGGQVSFDVEGNPIKNWLACAPPADEGVVMTCADGTALIKNLAMGKYTVNVDVPAGSTTNWVQTSTIEGTRGIDAWVKAGEPPYFQEFGTPGFHVFVGFVDGDRQAPGGPNMIEGTVTNLHLSRIPDQTLHDSGSFGALAFTTCWVGLNSGGGAEAAGDNIAVQKCDGAGHFNISGIPDGTYQLVVWDQWLDQIFASRTVTLPADAGDLGNVPVFNWFSRLETNIFVDANQNGVWDEGEAPLPNALVTLYHRDGSLYQTSTTDNSGFYSFDEMFPFFNWLVFEADPQNNKPTGLDVVVDAGGPNDSATLSSFRVVDGPYDPAGILNPQIQPGGSDHRVQNTPFIPVGSGPAWTQAVQGFIGQTSVVNWGQAAFGPGENGGITGRVSYASTRSEDDPRFAAINEWEPNVPNVLIRLYRQVPNGAGTGLVFVAETRTSSFDDNLPTGCPGQSLTDPFLGTLGSPIDKCYDGMHNWNQIRPGVYDGRYTFANIPPGVYTVEMVLPPGYELVKEEDKNVFIGDSYTAPASVVLPTFGPAVIIPQPAVLNELYYPPTDGILTPPCVGDARVVPDFTSLFNIEEGGEAPFAGMERPLCDRKQVTLTDRMQAVADFHIFTSTPVAAHGTGMILDDLTQEFNPASPNWGEKAALPHAPVSIKDFNGREISRLYSDQWGMFNVLLPSTFTANVPLPSGYAPAIHTACMNDPGPIPGPGGTMITDPQYNPGYSTFCYALQYMPGTTTYLDTPVVPISAFASGYPFVDCYYPDGTPVIRQVDGNAGGGPYVNANPRTLTIQSMGATAVPNPAYLGPGAGGPPKNLIRDFGFGATEGTVALVSAAGTTTTLSAAAVTWSNTTIIATLPAGLGNGAYELVVTRTNGRSTVNSVTVTVGGDAPIRVPGNHATIQAAIDAATPNQLILVAPGEYNELVVMWKPVRLQGYGAGSTTINAVKTPQEKLDLWRTKVAGLIEGGMVDLLPGQNGIDGAPVIGPGYLGTEEGAGITVLARNTTVAGQGSFQNSAQPARIDGFTITGGDSGGGIFVNGWAHRLQIANNRIIGNSSQFHGGMRIGHPSLLGLNTADSFPVDPARVGIGPFGFNRDVNIHHNTITTNGAFEGLGGGGIAICTGTDNYTVNFNYICGNFSGGDGGGIDHFGLSNNGHITNNKILFNQSFNQTTMQSGGGIFIGGEPDLPGGLTLGAGHVVVDRNLIQGNHAAAGHGGGIRLQSINGRDVELLTASQSYGPTPVYPTAPLNRWWQVLITNNVVVDNVAGWAGGGISLQDTARAFIIHNTVANNDSTATVGPVFTVGPNTAQYQPAGISSERHSPVFAAAFGTNSNFNPFEVYSNPVLGQSIVWHNRSFRYNVISGVGQLQALSANSGYWDLGLLGDPTTTVPNPTIRLMPTYSVLSSTTGYAGVNNTSTDPQFATPYFNGSRVRRDIDEVTNLLVLPALDEGGNWIDVRYGPLYPAGNYHLLATSPAVNSAQLGSATQAGTLGLDFDGEVRPSNAGPGSGSDRGADEWLNNNFTGSVLSLTLNPASVPGGNQTTGTVTLAAAPGAGNTVCVSVTDNGSLETSFTGFGADGRDVCISGAATSGNFTVDTIGVSALTTANFNASLNGSSVLATLTITVPGPLAIASLTFAPPSVTGGNSSTGTVTLSANAPVGGVDISIDDNTSTVTSFVAPGTADARTLNIPAGSNSGTFVVNTTAVAAVTNVNIDAVLGASTVTTALTVNPPGAFTPIRVDSGRTTGGVQTVNGVQWSQDTGFSGGNTDTVGSAIAGTTDDVLYQTERWGTFTYTFTVPAGSYSVTLKFAEVFFTGGGTGQRVFDVNINGGALELDNFDIKAAAGGAANAAVDRTFAVTAGAGANNLVIQFIDAGPDDPKVDAIEIVSAGPPPPPPPLTISSLTFAPSSVTGGNNSTGTVTLSANAPVGGVDISIDDNTSTVTSFAAPGTADARTLNIPAGSSSGTFVVNTTAVVAVTNVNIDAVLGASTVTTALTVNPPGAFTPIRVDSGRTTGGVQTVNGVQWSQDTGFSGGNTDTVGSAIAGTTDDVLYQTERWGTFTYTFTVPAGSYSVTLKFAEVFFTGGGTGQRVFDVNINGGALELDNFDIKAAAGGAANAAVDRTFAVTAGAGANNLVIQFIDAGPDDPKVDAIQIVAAP